jgi:hypothetical protein
VKAAKERRDEMNWSERGKEGTHQRDEEKEKEKEEKKDVALGASAGVSQFLVLYIIRCGAVHPSYIFSHRLFLPFSLQDHR